MPLRRTFPAAGRSTSDILTSDIPSQSLVRLTHLTAAFKTVGLGLGIWSRRLAADMAWRSLWVRVLPGLLKWRGDSSGLSLAQP